MPTGSGYEDDLIESTSHREAEIEYDALTFPINVHESLQAASGMRKGEKVGIIVSFWLFGCFILTSSTSYFSGNFFNISITLSLT